MKRCRVFVLGFILLILFSLFEDIENVAIFTDDVAITSQLDTITEEWANDKHDLHFPNQFHRILSSESVSSSSVKESLVDTNKSFLTTVFYQSSYVG